jgi:glutamyl-tRNA synthetase
VQWFDGSHLARSPAQWDPAKLAWVNAHYMKQADDSRLAALTAGQLQRRGLQLEPASLEAACALYKDRCATVVELADWVESMHAEVQADPAELATGLPDARPALRSCASGWPGSTGTRAR